MLPNELFLEIVEYLNFDDLQNIIFASKDALLSATPLIKFFQENYYDLCDCSLVESLPVFKTIYYRDRVFDKNKLLVEASMNGCLDVVKYLVANGADVNTSEGSALCYAVRCENLDTVKYLIENGADVNASDFVALKYACEGEHLDIAEVLIANSDGLSFCSYLLMEKACKWGQLNVVKFLSMHGVKLNNQFYLGYASRYGKIEVVKYLFENVKYTALELDYALRCSVSGGHLEVVKYLKEISQV